MRIGLTYDLRSEYLAQGYTEDETAEFDREDMPGRGLTFLQEIRDAIAYRDRLVLVVSVGILFAIALLIGAGPWMLDNVAPLVSNFLTSVAVILGLSSVIHVMLILPTMLIHRLLARLTGIDVV